MTLQIQEGKFYRTWDGRKVGPAVPFSGLGRNYVWKLSELTYTPDGCYWENGDRNHNDLVAEWSDDEQVNNTATTNISDHEDTLTDPVAGICNTKDIGGYDADLVAETFAPLEQIFPDTNPKTRMGAAKPSTFAIPPSAHIHLGLAMQNGAGKYGLMNWREHAVSSSVYFNAADRHLRAWQDGEDLAADSGVHHLAHVMACCAIVLDAMECGQLLDDRPLPGAASRLIDRLTKK